MLIERLKLIPECYRYNWRNFGTGDFSDVVIAPFEIVCLMLKTVGLIVRPLWILLLEPLWAVFSVSNDDIRWFIKQQGQRKDKPTSD